MHIDDTIFVAGFGKIYRHIFPAKRGVLVARPETTGCLSTRYSGYFFDCEMASRRFRYHASGGLWLV